MALQSTSLKEWAFTNNMRTQIELGRHVDTEGNTLHEEKGERFGFRQDEEVEIFRGDLVEI